MAIGLFFSAILNICFGLSTAVVALGSFWVANALFQGMGFPPCARLITHWFSPKELATKMSIWNTSHGLGAAAVLILCGYLITYTNNWRMCFFVPAALAIATTGLLLIYLRDTPQSVGLPEIEGTREAQPEEQETPQDFRKILRQRVFGNGYIWIFCVANFFVYTIRYAVLDWSPTMLKEYKGISLAHGGWMTAGFELAGAGGAICAGWLTDRFFDGKPARMSVFCMILCGCSLYVFWKLPGGKLLANSVMLMLAGFFVYGPQALIGVAAANLATKRAAATAVGLTGIFGYASGVLSGWGLGALVDAYGWSYAFVALFFAAACATIVFIIAWRAPRDGYVSA
jgi:OPA family glycerol-3-phosphate transporter-like MFS transporter/OPA family sugar phosphate sensor protein UhpC-like MFS transporter